jgi:hypothetical protein
LVATDAVAGEQGEGDGGPGFGLPPSPTTVNSSMNFASKMTKSIKARERSFCFDANWVSRSP